MASGPPPLFHLSMKPVERSKGGSATCKAAYSTGRHLFDGRLHVEHDYRAKPNVEALPLTIPKDAGPTVPRDRGGFWRAVEKAHTRGDAIPARTLDAAFPKELFSNQEAEKRVAISFMAWLTETHQVAVDGGMHLMPDNHHVDLVLTAKRIGPSGFGRKAEELDAISQQRSGDGCHGAVETIRAKWAGLCNAELAAMRSSARLDHRSYQRQGIEIVPGMHLGPKVAGMERRGVPSHRGDTYRERQAIRALSIRQLLWAETELRRTDPNRRIQEQISLLGNQIRGVHTQLASMAPPKVIRDYRLDLLVPKEPRLVLAQIGNRSLVHFFNEIEINEEAFLLALEKLERSYNGCHEELRKARQSWWPQMSVEEQFRDAYELGHGSDDLEALLAHGWERAHSLARLDLEWAQDLLKKSEKNLKEMMGPRQQIPTILMVYGCSTSPTPEAMADYQRQQSQRAQEHSHRMERARQSSPDDYRPGHRR